MLKKPFAAAVFSLALVAETTAQQPAIERLDPGLDALLDANTTIETISTGYQWCEGPVWDKASDELLFSDVPENVIHAWKNGAGVRIFMKPSGYTGVTPYGTEPGSNGLAFDSQGRLLLCEHGDRRISMLTPNGGKITLADRYKGKRFNSPNDLTIGRDGTIYFTDPIYGLPEKEKDSLRELDFCGVYQLGNDGSVTLLTREIERPNGIALSPDEKTLYIANSHGPRPLIFKLDLTEANTPARLQTFFDTSGLSGRGLPDGMKTDPAGNLWATGPGGLLIISAQGKLLGRAITHRATSNIAFGGNDGKSVFLTADDRILRFKRK
jgi:gluconolactonase